MLMRNLIDETGTVHTVVFSKSDGITDEVTFLLYVHFQDFICIHVMVDC